MQILEEEVIRCMRHLGAVKISDLVPEMVSVLVSFDLRLGRDSESYSFNA